MHFGLLGVWFRNSCSISVFFFGRVRVIYCTCEVPDLIIILTFKGFSSTPQSFSDLNTFISLESGKFQTWGSSPEKINICIKEGICGQRRIYLTISSAKAGFKVHRALACIGSHPDLNLHEW